MFGSIAKWIKWQLRRLNPFKGQKGQDRWVMFKVLPLKRGGFFIDLAAADGLTHSNTYVMEKFFGWQGVCIEPNPGFTDVLRARRNCIIEPVVVSDVAEQVVFRIDNGQLGGIVADDTDNSEAIRSDQLKNAETRTFDAVTLSELLDRNDAPKIIDYMSLDVEGAEERVIRGMDFDKYQIRCITIERPTPKVNEILFANGYSFVKNHRFDSFYIKADLIDKHIECQPFEQVPAKDW